MRNADSVNNVRLKIKFSKGEDQPEEKSEERTLSLEGLEMDE